MFPIHDYVDIRVAHPNLLEIQVLTKYIVRLVLLLFLPLVLLVFLPYYARVNEFSGAVKTFSFSFALSEMKSATTLSNAAISFDDAGVVIAVKT